MDTINDHLLSYVKPINHKFKTEDQIKLYLKLLVRFYYKLEPNNFKIKKIYTFYDNLLSTSTLVVLPEYLISISMSENGVRSVFGNSLINNSFSEKIIKFKYYHTELKTVVDSPNILILKNTDWDSIIFEDNESLKCKILDIS